MLISHFFGSLSITIRVRALSTQWTQASEGFEMEAHLASIPDAIRLLSIGRSTLYRLIAEGKLETVKIGRRTLIRVSSIRALAGENGDA